MEIGVRAETENLQTGEIRPIATAFLTVIALDADGLPAPAPALTLKTDEDRARHREAIARRKACPAGLEKVKVCRLDSMHCD